MRTSSTRSSKSRSNNAHAWRFRTKTITKFSVCRRRQPKKRSSQRTVNSRASGIPTRIPKIRKQLRKSSKNCKKRTQFSVTRRSVKSTTPSAAIGKVRRVKRNNNADTVRSMGLEAPAFTMSSVTAQQTVTAFRFLRIVLFERRTPHDDAVRPIAAQWSKSGRID